jgi:peptide-methionine (S)-S-oxide reductase
MRRSFLQIAGFGALAFVAAFAIGIPPVGPVTRDSSLAPDPQPTAAERTALFAGGCFWSMQKAFDGVSGVVSVTAGYAGGKVENPSYHQVGSGATGHAESVKVIYDPATISYDKLLDIYWHHIDPLTLDAAFCDHGPQYRSIIFYSDSGQQRAAEASKRALDESHRFPTPIVTAIEPAAPFYPAEEYHQQYYKKNPASYQAYVIGCRRNERIRQLWGEVALNKESTR